MGKKYEGIIDPTDYIANYSATMKLQDAIDDFLCHDFSMTLDKETRS